MGSLHAINQYELSLNNNNNNHNHTNHTNHNNNNFFRGFNNYHNHNYDYYNTTTTTERKMMYSTAEQNKQNKQNKLAVIWIDAHADINTLESSESGNVHGMPLAFITGIDKSWNWVNSTNLKLDFNDLYYWGIRDLDNFEIDIIDKYGIKVCSDKEDVMSIVDQYQHIHTSLDIDGLDPKYAPS